MKSNSSKQLVIIGTGETAFLAYEYFIKDSPFEVVAFAVDAQYKAIDELYGLPVLELESLEQSHPPKDTIVFVALSSTHLNRDRTKLYLDLKNRGYSFASYVSSKAFVWDNVEIGENCFILENNVLQPFTWIGNNVTLWSGNHIGHRTVVKDHAFISSHCVISGFCEIGEYSFLGVNATIGDNLSIAADNFIGMGGVVNKNTEANGLYVGNPATRHKLAAKRFCKVKGDK
jgi:sugar O-acyltransferase (sialic acid O-acetyltransferase NeuD family)